MSMRTLVVPVVWARDLLQLNYGTAAHRQMRMRRSANWCDVEILLRGAQGLDKACSSTAEFLSLYHYRLPNRRALPLEPLYRLLF